MKPNNPNPFYMVYQSFWSELRLKGAVKEVFAVIYGRCAYSGNATEISIKTISGLTGLSRQTIISAIDSLVKAGLIERLPAKSSSPTRSGIFVLTVMPVSTVILDLIGNLSCSIHPYLSISTFQSSLRTVEIWSR